MKSIPGKYHLLACTNDNIAIRIGNFQGKALRYTIWEQAVFRLSFIRYM